MEIACGLQHEAFGYQFGTDYMEERRRALSSREILLVAGRNDRAAFQVMLAGDEDFTVNVGERPVFSPYGRMENIRLSVEIDGLNRAEAEMNPVGLIADDDRTLRSDILLNDEVVYVDKARVQPVWVEVQIPRHAPGGHYCGRVHVYSQSMFGEEEIADTLPFELEVKEVSVPEPREYEFHLDLWQHPSNIARKHEVILWSEEHFAVLERYISSLGDLGQKAATAIVSEIPWSGQRCYRTAGYPSDLFEFSMVRVVQGRDGSYSCDYSALERYLELCFEHGIDREIEVFGLTNIWEDEQAGYGKIVEDYPDAIRIRYRDEADGCFKYMREPAAVSEYIADLAAFFKKKGWMDRVLIAADEPGDTGRYRRMLDRMRAIDPDFRFKTAINHAEFIEEFSEEIADFVPLLDCACSRWDKLEELKPEITGRLLWYVCCHPPRPNTFISSPLVESRLIPLLTSFMGFDGFLRWNYTVWPETPRERISYRSPSWRAGDTNFVYPGRDGRPLLTLRYKNLRRGIEDFELIRRVKFCHPKGEKVVKKALDLVLKTDDIGDFHPESGLSARDLYSLKYEDYHRLRDMLLTALESQQAQ